MSETEKFRIRITDELCKNMWYRVGQEFNCTYYNDTLFIIVDGKYQNELIAKGHCIILPVPETVETKPTNPKDAAATTRLDLSLFPMSGIIYGALGMTEGDLKYGGYNFREAGVNVSVYIAAAMRHAIKYYNGEWADSKTKVPHLASMLSCAAILVDGHVQNNITDDRPPTIDMAGLLDEMQELVKHLQTVFPPENKPPRCTEVKDCE